MRTNLDDAVELGVVIVAPVCQLGEILACLGRLVHVELHDKGAC
jgi:hypothetical protein